MASLRVPIRDPEVEHPEAYHFEISNEENLAMANELTDEKQKLIEQLKTATREADRWEIRNEENLAKLKELTDEKQKLTEELKTANREADRLEIRNKEHIEKIKELTDEKQKLVEKLETATREKHLLEISNAESLSMVKAITEERTKLREELNMSSRRANRDRRGVDGDIDVALEINSLHDMETRMNNVNEEITFVRSFIRRLKPSRSEASIMEDAAKIRELKVKSTAEIITIAEINEKKLCAEIDESEKKLIQKQKEIQDLTDKLNKSAVTHLERQQILRQLQRKKNKVRVLKEMKYNLEQRNMNLQEIIVHKSNENTSTSENSGRNSQRLEVLFTKQFDLERKCEIIQDRLESLNRVEVAFAQNNTELIFSRYEEERRSLQDNFDAIKLEKAELENTIQSLRKDKYLLLQTVASKETELQTNNAKFCQQQETLKEENARLQLRLVFANMSNLNRK